MEAVLQHSACSAHGAVKATLCPYAPTHCSLNTYVVSIYYVYRLPTMHSSRAMPIHMHAIAQRLRTQLTPSAHAFSTLCF